METADFTIHITDPQLTLKEVAHAIVFSLQIAPEPIPDINTLLKINQEDTRLFAARFKQLIAHLSQLTLRLAPSQGKWWLVIGPLPKPALKENLLSFFEHFFIRWLKNDCAALLSGDLRLDTTFSSFQEYPITFGNNYREVFEKKRADDNSYFYSKVIKKHSVYIFNGTYAASNVDLEVLCFRSIIDYLRERHSHITSFTRTGKITIDIPMLKDLLSFLPDSEYRAFVRPRSGDLVMSDGEIVILISAPSKTADIASEIRETEIQGLHFGILLGPFDSTIQQLVNLDYLSENGGFLEPTGKARRCFKEDEGHFTYYSEIDDAYRELALAGLRRITGLDIEIDKSKPGRE